MQQNAIDGLIVDHENNSLNSRALCFAPAKSGVSDIVLSYPQWYFAGHEADWPQNYTVTAAVEYPIGHFTPVYRNGQRSVTVQPGTRQIEFDPGPVRIPPNERFYVKSHATWVPGRFPLGSGVAVNWKAGEYSFLQTGAPDLTLEPGQPGETSFAAGFAPTVFGRLDTSLPVLGVIGDSISRAFGPDSPDPTNGACFVRRAIRNAFPVLEANRSGDGFRSYFVRHTGRDALLFNRITHLIVGLGRNDLASGISAAAVADMLQRLIAPYLARGVICSAFTALPTSVSSDGWATISGQSIADSRLNKMRIQYNEWLRSQWHAIGLNRIFDVAAAVEHGTSGLWNADGSQGYQGGGYARLSGGAVSDVVLGLGGGGADYPSKSRVPCAVIRQFGDASGAGASVEALTDAHGRVTSFNVLAGGQGYKLPPWIAPRGAWTKEGVHPDKRGYDEMIVKAGISPSAFAF